MAQKNISSLGVDLYDLQTIFSDVDDSVASVTDAMFTTADQIQNGILDT